MPYPLRTTVNRAATTESVPRERQRSGPYSGTPMFSRAELVASAIRLSFVTIGWNALGGAATLAAAIAANSLSLGGFALNMLLDTSASAVLVWRFKKEARDPVAARRLEQHAQTGIALAMSVVAVYLVVQSARALHDGTHVHRSVIGIVLAIASLAFLPWLARRKLALAHLLHSRALRGDGMLSAASAALAAITLSALAANALFDWWWSDPAAALVIAAALALEAVRLARHRLGSAEPEV
jgi:divalent metal cation (Fe/Co/Zn/Cd) transporter